MVLAAKQFIRGDLPGIEGDVFYATLYGKSPERIENAVEFAGDEFAGGTDFPSPELDRMFRKIA